MLSQYSSRGACRGACSRHCCVFWRCLYTRCKCATINAIKKLNSIIDNAFFSENLPIKIPWASATLRDHAADGDVLLDIFESRLARLMTEKVQNQPPTATAQPDDRWAAAKADAVRRIIQAVFEARKYRGSNVSWQSATDLLLLTISKEIFYADGHRRSV